MINEFGSESQQTSASLLQGMRDGDQGQWERFANLYGPLVYEWCRRAGIPQTQSADVAQEVFRAVARKLVDFRRDRPGDTFHGWLWRICRYKTLDYFRSMARQPAAKGGSAAHVHLNEIPDELPEVWDAEQQQQDTSLIYQRAVELLQTEFETHTWQAFWRTVVEDQRPADVAAGLQMTVGAVYNARYKVLKRLRLEFEGLFDMPDDPRAE